MNDRILELRTFFSRLVCSRTLLLILYFTVFVHSVKAQAVAELTADFYAIQKEIGDYFELNPDASGRKQWKRKEWFLEPRLFPDGRFENITLNTWQAYRSYTNQQYSNRSTHGEWTFIGPSECSVGLGRINSIAFHPTNANIFYIGSANGGIWKTINGGLSWSNISPDIPMLAIHEVAMDPANSNIIYVLTGDGDPGPIEGSPHSMPSRNSIGVIVSYDAGITWYPTNFTLDRPSNWSPHRLLVHPTNGQIQFALGGSMVLKTEDGWVSRDTVTYLSFREMEFKPGDPSIMYASGGSSIFRSIDMGSTWNPVSDDDFVAMSGASRVKFASSTSNPAKVYALAGNTSEIKAVLVSNDSGSSNSWSALDPNNTSEGMGTFGAYAMGLAVDPTNSSKLFGGTQFIHFSSNSGNTWTNATQSEVHADIHDIKYAHGAVWVCTDGGLYKSSDDGNTWTELTTGLAITEIYRIAGTPANTNLYFNGNQDNGTMRKNSLSTVFDFVKGADGTTCLIDPTNSNNVYTSRQEGIFFESTTGGGQGSYSNMNVPGGLSAWISPMILDPNNAQRIFVGKDTLFRRDSGPGPWIDMGEPTGSNLNCLAMAPSNSNTLYASSGSHLVVTNQALSNGIVVWADISGGLPNLFITGISVDPNISNRIFVTISGYLNNNKVFRSDNGGVSWVNISGSLPNLPVNCIEFHDNGLDNDAIYIGTDIGVFYRDNDLGDWTYYSNSMPAVMVNDLYINTGDNTIVAGTYGRGLWRSPLHTACMSSKVIINNTGQPINGTNYTSVSSTILSTADYAKDIGANIHYSAGDVIVLADGFELGGQGFFQGVIGPCPVPTSDEIPFSIYNPSGIFKVQIQTGQKIDSEKVP